MSASSSPKRIVVGIQIPIMGLISLLEERLKANNWNSDEFSDRIYDVIESVFRKWSEEGKGEISEEETPLFRENISDYIQELMGRWEESNLNELDGCIGTAITESLREASDAGSPWSIPIPLEHSGTSDLSDSSERKTIDIQIFPGHVGQAILGFTTHYTRYTRKEDLAHLLSLVGAGSSDPKMDLTKDELSVITAIRDLPLIKMVI